MKKDLEDNFLSKERNSLSEERTALAYIRTELTFLGVTVLIFKLYFDKYPWTVALTYVLFAVFLVLTIYHAVIIGKLRKKRKGLKAQTD